MKNSRLIPYCLAFLLWASAPPPAWAQPDLCESAAARAAHETGVPLDVLLAISLTETGRQRGGRLRPWPWAANTEGRGHWFDTRDAAAGFLRDTLARGQRNIDLGCFQINLRWHGMNFDTPEAMLDPLTSARYAANHLANLHTEFGNWEGAAGAYHSRTPRHNTRYRARFRDMRTLLEGTVTEAAPTRVALFTGTASGASLVPTPAANATPLIVLRP